MTELRRIDRPLCPVCGGAGETAHDDLVDRLFGAPGRWALRICPRDGCGWLDPAPHPDDLALAYREYYTHSAASVEPTRALRSGAQRVWAAWRLGYPMPAGWRVRIAALALLLRPRRIEQAAFLRLHLPHVEGGTLLDVGCGAGNQLRVMRELGWAVSGLDFDAAAVAAARAGGLDVRHGDLMSAVWPDAHFDAVSMVHVIEHLVLPERHLRECLRILKPGGHLMVITPNLRSLGSRRFGRDWRGLEPPRHLQIYSPQALRTSLVDAGFTIRAARTSARDAGHLLWFSDQLRAARRSGDTHVALREAGGAFAHWRRVERLERACVRLGLPIGEEIVALARKPFAVATSPE